MDLSRLEKLAKKKFLQDRKAAKKSPIYKKLRREYSIPKGFDRYNDVILDVVMNGLMRLDLDESESTYRRFRPKFEAASLVMMLELNEPAVYCLHNKLLEAIELTDLPDYLPGLKQTVPLGILLLPRELVEPGEKHGISYIAFSHYSMLDKYPNRKGIKYTVDHKKESWRSVKWFASLTDGTDYCEEASIAEDGKIISNSDNGFISKITSILIQSLYFIQEGRYIAAANPVKDTRTGRGFTKQPKTQVLRHPKHLGKEFTLAKDRPRSNPSYPTTRASPVGHFRRGHRKIIRHGEGRKLEKMVWIAPNWIGEEN